MWLRDIVCLIHKEKAHMWNICFTYLLGEGIDLRRLSVYINREEGGAGGGGIAR